MSRTLSQLLVSIALATAALTVAPVASADDVKMVGVITKIKMAGDADRTGRDGQYRRPGNP